ncbi:MAG: hypothetical protein J6S08_05355 [Duodenibacillus sp.]|nr:hypothetical protein [Duodenibacillus sp.]
MKKMLMGLLSLSIFSSAHAALSWPDGFELNPDVLAQGSQGDILAEIVLQMVEPWNLNNPPNNGLVSLAISDHQGVHSLSQGVFSVTEDDSIGIAFVGTITFNYDSNFYTDTKGAWNSPLASHVSGWTAAEALIRTYGTKSGKNHSVSLSGRLLFVRLRSGPITATEIKFPRLVLEYRASGKGPEDNWIEVFVPNSTGGTITTPRTCSVVLSGAQIDFGHIRNIVAPQSTPLSQGRSSIGVQCTGISNQTTSIDMSVRSASGQITGDSSSIPMVNAANNNNDLVVKGTFGSTVPNCFSTDVLSASDTDFESKWLNVLNGTKYHLFRFDPSSSPTNVTQNKTVNWYLCRKSGSAPLPIGRYSASAVLSITFN